MLVSISGALGVGKSTICKLLHERNGWGYIPEIIDKTTKPPAVGPGGDVYKTEMWFLKQYFKKDERLSNIINKNKITIADRWLHDVLLYSEAFMEMGKFPHNEFIDFKVYYDYLDGKIRHPTLELVLYANNSSIQKRIEKRLRKDKKKWKEDDKNYVKIINKKFRDYYKNFAGFGNMELVDTSRMGIEQTYDKCKSVIEKYL